MLISLAEERGHEVVFCDCYLDENLFDPEEIFTNNKIEVVAIYLNTICLDGGLNLVSIINQYRVEGKWSGIIVAGGPHTSIDSVSLPSSIDHIVIGEGEISFFEILDGSEKRRVVFGKKCNDLNVLPFQPWHIFAKLGYDKKVPWLNREKIFTLNTSRGCPFSCTFCSVNSIWGKSYRYQSADRILSEIYHLINEYGADGIYFREDHFTLNKERLYEFCNIILKNNLALTWACETRVDALNSDVIKLMAQSGCRAVYLGIESGSQKMLDFYQKGIKARESIEIIKILKKNGISVYCSFVVGVPEESPFDLIKTYYFINRSSPDAFSLNIYIGIPGSDLYKKLLQSKNYEFKDSLGLLYPKGFHVKSLYFYGKSSKTLVDHKFTNITLYDIFLFFLFPVRYLHASIKKMGFIYGTRKS